MNQQPKTDALSEFSERVAYVVTDLNDLISSVVNGEVASSDFDNDLTYLFNQLKRVEAAVAELGTVFWTGNDSTEEEIS